MNHSCAILKSDKLKCWGWSSSGANFVGANTPTPVTISIGMTGLQSVTVGNTSTCVSNMLGAVQCWGNNQSGLLGNGTNTNVSSLAPTNVTGISNVISLTSAEVGSCALLNTGYIQCWGELYDANVSTLSNIPVLLAGLKLF
jgi:alpha-tubulin suppressor-like RCC1 family protein